MAAVEACKGVVDIHMKKFSSHCPSVTKRYTHRKRLGDLPGKRSLEYQANEVSSRWVAGTYTVANTIASSMSTQITSRQLGSVKLKFQVVGICSHTPSSV